MEMEQSACGSEGVHYDLSLYAESNSGFGGPLRSVYEQEYWDTV